MKRIFFIFAAAASSLLLLLLCMSAQAFAQQAEKPTVYGVLIDNTRSMEKQFAQVSALGRALVKRLSRRGPVSLYNFTWKRDEAAFILARRDDAAEGGNHDRAVAQAGVEWSRDENELSRYLDALTIVRGHTALYEAVQTMADALDRKATAETDAFAGKTVVLITDGDQRVDLKGSIRATEDERKEMEGRLIKALKASGVRVYAVGLIRELDAYGGFNEMTTKEKAESFLKKVTKETGGRVVFPKSKFDAEAVIDELFKQ